MEFPDGLPTLRVLVLIITHLWTSGLVNILGLYLLLANLDVVLKWIGVIDAFADKKLDQWSNEKTTLSGRYNGPAVLSSIDKSQGNVDRVTRERVYYSSDGVDMSDSVLGGDQRLENFDGRFEPESGDYHTDYDSDFDEEPETEEASANRNQYTARGIAWKS